MSGMKWMDLGRHGLQLGIVEQSGGPALCVQGGVRQHAVDLDALGFVETPEVGWVREDVRVNQGFWQDLKARFPLSSVVEVSVDRLFFRVDTAAPVQAPAVSVAPARAHPHQVSYVTAGEHRGKRRLWMEGMRLERAGFVPGARYVVSLDLDRRRLTLSIDPDGGSSTLECIAPAIDDTNDSANDFGPTTPNPGNNAGSSGFINPNHVFLHGFESGASAGWSTVVP